MVATGTQATIGELFEVVFSVGSVREYNEGQLPLEKSLDTAIIRVGVCCGTVAIRQEREHGGRGGCWDPSPGNDW
jgi:hypothetical protein